MTESIELVIFDCDGVLIDSELISCAAEAEALAEIGYNIDAEEVIERFAGVPSEVMYSEIEIELGHPLSKNFEADVTRRILEKYRSELRSIDGAADVLSLIKTKKCVASSSAPAKLAWGLLETELFELLYPNIFSTKLVHRGKPHPDIFEYAAHTMGVDRSRCIVVEDSIAGVTAANAAGMVCLGFTGGSHCSANQQGRLLAAGARAVLANLNELMNHI